MTRRYRQTAPAAAGSRTALIEDRQQEPSVNVQACWWRSSPWLMR